MLMNQLFVLCLLSLFLPSLGAIFPTKPVSTTVYTAGSPAQVSWTEDGKRPLLNSTRGLRIDLYAGNSTYLATLARDLSAMALNTTVYLPTNIPKNYHTYILRFITSDPVTTIYTSDFAINPSPFTARPKPSSSRTLSSSGSLSSSAPTSADYVSTTIITSTVISRVLPTSDAQGSNSRSLRGLLSLGRQRRVRPMSERRSYIDVEKIKFRLVFIVWPVLVGFSMAW